MKDHVVIVGAGFAGTLQAINLLRHDGPRATLIERRVRAGEGVAYGDADPAHVLNVRAASMSALPDEPDHFTRWLNNAGHDDAGHIFVAHSVHGIYLREMLAKACASSPDRLAVIQDDAVDLAIDGCSVSVKLASGGSVEADIAVLAVGNLPPHSPPGLDAADFDPDCYCANPWREDPSMGLTNDDHVLILGTGLTMVDTVLKLRSDGFMGRITAMSRRGLLPHRHGEQVRYDPITDGPAPEASRLLAAVRRRAVAIGWRNAVDELRPFTQSMWRAADKTQRARFLRHLRPWWDVHRHRIAPPVAEKLERFHAEGSLEVIAAKTNRFTQESSTIRVAFRPRGAEAIEFQDFRRVINCIGPQGDLSRTDEPLLRRLVDRGHLRPDVGHLGIDVDAQGRAVGATGESSDRLYAIGPMTRSAF